MKNDLHIIQAKILKFVAIFIFCAASFSFAPKASYSLPLPFSMMMNPYIGVDFLLGGQFTRGFNTVNGESFFNSIYQFYNMQANAGLRVHKNFGFEFFASRWNYKITPDSTGYFKTDNFGFTANIYLQLPGTDFLELIGTNIELYGIVGFALLNGKTSGIENSATFNQVVPKFGGGIQLRVFNFTSIKFGVDYYYLSVPNSAIKLGGVMFYNLGFNFYFF